MAVPKLLNLLYRKGSFCPLLSCFQCIVSIVKPCLTLSFATHEVLEWKVRAVNLCQPHIFLPKWAQTAFADIRWVLTDHARNGDIVDDEKQEQMLHTHLPRSSCPRARKNTCFEGIFETMKSIWCLANCFLPHGSVLGSVAENTASVHKKFTI